MNVLSKIDAEQIRSFFLYILFLSIPFSIAGDHFAIFGLYICTLYLFLRKRESWESNLMIYSIAVLLFGASLSSTFSDNPLAGFSYFRNFWRLGLPFAVFFALKKRDHWRYINVLVFISILIGLYAVAQFFTGLDLFRSENLRNVYKSDSGEVWHAVGFFSHHLTFGGVSLLLFSLVTPLMIDKTLPWRNRILYATASILNLLGAVFTMGRSIWLGLIASMGVIILLKLKVKGYLAIGLLVCIGCGAFSMLNDSTKDKFFKHTAFGRRLTSFSLSSNIDRLMMWEAGLKVVKDHPFLGLGPRQADLTQDYYREVAKKYNRKFQHHASVGVHNIYIQNWIDFGLIGLLGYLSWWILFIGENIYSLKRRPQNKNGTDSILIGISAGFLAIMIAGFFENNFRDGEVQTTILTLMGLSLAVLYKKKVGFFRNEKA